MSRSRLRIGLAFTVVIAAAALGATPADASRLYGVRGVGQFGSGALLAIEYKETATAQRNDLEYARGPSPTVEGCAPTPGPSCNSVGVLSDQHVFLDRTGTLNSAAKSCEQPVGSRLATCHGPSDFVCDEFFASCVAFLTIRIDLGRLDDAFSADVDNVAVGPIDPVFGLVVRPAWRQIFRFELSGGSGNDSIELLDRTNDGSLVQQPGIATDQISCGSGKDTVRTTPATVVAADCEKVQRVS